MQTYVDYQIINYIDLLDLYLKNYSEIENNIDILRYMYIFK